MFIYDLFEKFMLFFFSSKCYDDVILNLNLTNFACLKLALSKCLGYGVVAGSLMVRVPQILVIFGSSSAEGISFISEVLLMIAITGTMGYGFYKDFPISTYGDSYALYVQGAIILSLMCFYQKQYTSLFMYSVVLIVYPILLFNNQINVNIIYALNGAQLFLSFTSKLIQAIVNYQNSSTGKLSAITLMLQFLGCIARIFTSVQETGDLSLIVSYSLATFINGVLVLQLLYYWNKEKESVKKDQ